MQQQPASLPPGPESRVGTEVRGKWRIDALIGVGGMAAVYAATHRNRRRAALKILNLELAHDTLVRERFLREGYLGNKVEHPGKVETLDNDVTEDGAPFLVMELLEGENLAELWRRMGKKLPVAAALRLTEQLLDFLSACHAQDIVHRDLKPANVFVTTDQRVKVLDFGVAQLRDTPGQDHTRAGTALGTPAFMAPEQARGLGDKLDGRADIFSVGAMLYALLSGQRLHQGRTSDEALVLAATQPAPSLARVAPDLPPPVLALVDKALAWDRRNRFQTAAEMRAEVLRILERPSMRAEAHPSTFSSSGETEAAFVVDVVGQAERLASVFRQVDRLLPTVRQYGFAHPETERRLRATFEECVAALGAAPDGVSWDVRPYSFEHHGRAVWEPTAPFDSVPWALFDAGLRSVQLRPGLAQSELRALVEVMLTDPSTELAPEDDLVTILWDRALPSVAIESADGLGEGGAAARESFYRETSEVENLAARAALAEARAMNVSTDDRERREVETRSEAQAALLALDPITRAALETQLRLPSERFRERWFDVVIDALIEAIAHHDEALVLTPLAASAADLISRGSHEAVLATLRSLSEVVALRVRSDAERALLVGSLTRAMLGGDRVPLMAGVIGGDQITNWSASLAHLGAADLPHVLRALERAQDERVQAALLDTLSRLAVGREAEVAHALPQLPPAVAQSVVTMLGKMRTPGAAPVLRSIAASGNVALRISALSSTGQTAMRTELAALIAHEKPNIRLAALTAIADNHVAELVPALVKRIDELFHDLPLDERVALLETVHRIEPLRAEQIAIGILGQRGMLKRESRDQSRALCAQHLGKYARSRAALEAVNGATKGLLGGSKAVETAAAAAAVAIAARSPS